MNSNENHFFFVPIANLRGCVEERAEITPTPLPNAPTPPPHTDFPSVLCYILCFTIPLRLVWYSKNSPGLGPGCVRSSAGLVLVLVLVLVIGEGLPSPPTPLPWAFGSEICLPDPPSKIGVILLFDTKNTIKSTEMHS